MGKINLLIANANLNFNKTELDILRSAAQKAEKFISDHFLFDYTVDIVVATPLFFLKTIPEDGISGHTYNSRFIVLVIDKHQTKIKESTVFETICHEMSHSLRWEKLPEYFQSMFDGIVFEGLAVALEEKAMNDSSFKKQQYFLTEMQNTSQATIDNITAHLKDTLHDEHYDYNTVFFTGDATLPRWAGYRLGYHLIKRYLEQTGETVEQATFASYDKFKNVKM